MSYTGGSNNGNLAPTWDDEPGVPGVPPPTVVPPAPGETPCEPHWCPPNVCLWAAEVYPPPYETRTLVEQQDGSWCYGGDYGGCDDCGHKLNQIGNGTATTGYQFQFSINLGGSWLPGEFGAMAWIAIGTDIGITTLYWDGAVWTEDYPLTREPLPPGVLSFAHHVGAGETLLSVEAMLGQNGDLDPKDRPWCLTVHTCGNL